MDIVEGLVPPRVIALRAGDPKLSLFINGAFVSAQVFSVGEAAPVLIAAIRALIAAARKPKSKSRHG